MSTLKVNTILSADTPTVNITDGLNVTGVSTVAALNSTSIVNATALSNRNIIINGAMMVAQRGTSSTSTGLATVDRIFTATNSVDEAPTFAQVDVSSGTTPYTSGFRKAFKVTNGNQTGGAGSSDRVEIMMRLESQDIANSGWNYTSTSSFITFSFWIKSSVAQNFYGRIQTQDGTQQRYAIETGSLTADTWTKITKTIPGNSNLQFDNNNAEGLRISLYGFLGTDYTDSSSLNTWAASATGNRTQDNTSTWYTTNDATLEVTGYQLEVGSVATPFEHRSFGDELQRCRRYYQVLVDQADGTSQKSFAIACAYSSSSMHSTHLLSPEMRAVPTLDYTTGTDYYRAFSNGSADPFNEFNLVGNSHPYAVDLAVFSDLSVTSGSAVLVRTYNAAARVAFTAEL